MNMQKSAPPAIYNVRIINEFNTIFNFITGMQSTFNGISNLFNPDKGLSEKEMLKLIKDQLDNMGNDIGSIISTGNLTQQQVSAILNLQNSQSKLLNQINSNINKITDYITSYLPAILGGINALSVQSQIIIRKLDAIMAYLSKIDKVLDNVVLNSGLIEIMPAYNSLRHISSRYNALSKDFSGKIDTKNITKAMDTPEYIELYDFCKNLTSSGLDNVIFHLDTLNSSLLGHNFLNRSSMLLIINALIDKETIYPTESDIAHLKSFLITLVYIQANAYCALLACRAIVGYAPYDYSKDLISNLEAQRKLFFNLIANLNKDNKITRLSNLSTNNLYDLYKYTLRKNEIKNRSGEFKFRAKPGNAICGIHFEKNKDEIKLIIQEAKPGKYYHIDSDHIIETTYDISNEWLSSSELLFTSPEKEHVITGLDLDAYTIVQAYVSPYDPEEGVVQQRFIPMNAISQSSKDFYLPDLKDNKDLDYLFANVDSLTELVSLAPLKDRIPAPWSAIGSLVVRGSSLSTISFIYAETCLIDQFQYAENNDSETISR